MRSPEECALIAAIADDLGAGVWVATAPEGRFVYANRAFDEIMGMGPVDVAAGEYAAPYGIFGRDGKLYPEERMPFVRALRARAPVTVDDIVIHRRDGRRVFVHALARPMLDASGEISHIVIPFYDITRQVEAEEGRARAEAERAELLRRELAARRSAEDAAANLHRLLANAPIVLYAFDLASVLTTCEGRGLSGLGVTAAELIGRPIVELYADAPAVVAMVHRVLAGETVHEIVEVGPAVFESWMSPLFADEGAQIGAIGVSTDVTERRRLETQLAQSERLASVGMLAAGVAHEINNPLSFVIGNLDLVDRQLAADGSALTIEAVTALREGALKEARQGASRVRTIVRDLKLFASEKERVLEILDLRRPLEASISMARNEIRHRARLLLDVDRALLVESDEGRLGQVFLNLLINAAHAIPEGAADLNEIKVKTGIAAARGGEADWVSVEVTDSGVGIARELLPRIFDPFFTTKPVGAGTGLGLAICYAIVTELHGRIEVDSAVGKGSTFRVLLRRARPANEEEGAGRATALSPVPVARRGRVLVIDDEPMLLKMVKSLLSGDHEVETERRAEGALARIARGERFDAILCDLMMPEVTGMDFYDRLMSIDPDQAGAVLFLTGGAFTARARAFVDAHEGVTLDKPFDVAKLTKRVRQLVG